MVEFVSGFDLEVSISPGADRSVPSVSWDWTEVTTSARLASGIEIETGRQDERSQVQPGRCTLTFDNRGGDFTRTNPLGQWYGSLSKNTPLRVRVTPTADEVTDTFTRSVTDGWGTATSGQVWHNYENGGTVADYDVTGTAGTHAVQANSTYRISYLPAVQLEDALVKVTVTVAVPTGGVIEPANLLLRMQDVDTYYMCRLTVTQTTNAITAAIFSVVDGVETSLGSAATGLTHAGATALNVRAEAVGDVVRMRAWQGGAEPGSWAVSVTDTTITSAGWVGIRSGVGSGNTNVKPLTFTYDNVTCSGPHDLFLGEVPEWAPRWHKSGNDRFVPITAAGVLRRLAQGTPALKSPAFQALSGVDSSRVDYWPLEEDSDAETLTSPVGSTPPGIANEVTFGGYTASPSAERMLLFGTEGLLFFTVRPYTSTEHKIVALWKVPDAGLAGNRIAMRIYPGAATFPFIDLVISTTGSLTLNLYNTSLAVADSHGPVAAAINGRECLISIELTQSGANISSTIFVQYADDGSSLTSSDTLAGFTIGRINFITIGEEDLDGTAFGHLGVGSDTSLAFANFISTTPPGVTGYAGEQASARIQRLLEQAGVPIVIKAGESEEMGPQLIDSIMANVRDSEKSDHGVVYELGTGLAFQPRRARYVTVAGESELGAEVALEIDGATELGDAPEPIDDEQFLLNDVTYGRPDGGSARYEATGKYAPDGPVGRYDSSDDLNLKSDYRLLDHAQWAVSQGTQDDLRWPVIPLQLSNDSGLALRWLGVGVGSRITVTTPPEGVAPDDLDLFVEGWSCSIGDSWWFVSMNCSPARINQVLTANGSDNTARADTAGSTLSSGITTTGTSLSVATTTGPLWTTSSGDRPFDIAIGGERMTVTNLTGASSPQTFTVTRSVNGIVKAHSSGAAVELWQPYLVGL